VRTPILVALLALPLLACDNEPGEGKPTAAVAEAVAPATTPVTTAGAEKLAFSEQGSKVEFVGAKITGKHEGSFQKFSGVIDLVDLAPEKSAVTVDVDVASLKTDDAKLDEHLKTPDFFDAAKYPKARFQSTSVKKEADGKYTITGNLELHGVQKSITFPAAIRTTTESAEVDAEFVINRKDFGIVYPGKPDDLIKDDVALKLTIRALKN
jgi:polyisoprenoid-binding protein YceI